MTLAHHSMEMWEPRLATSLKEARARTGLVHIIRLLFTIGAMLSAGVLIGYLVNHSLNGTTTHDQTRALSAPPWWARVSKAATPTTSPMC